MDIEDEKEVIDFDLKCVHNVMSNFEDKLCNMMQDKVNGIREYIKKQQLVINEMATTIVDEGIFADKCQCKIDADECDENCEKCIIEYFTKKVKKEGIKE